MTDDPVRILSAGSGASATERALLASLREAAPPAGAEQAGWRSISAQLALAGALGAATVNASTGSAQASATTASAAASGATWGSKALLTKLLIVSTIGALGGVAVVVERSAAVAPLDVVASQPLRLKPVTPPAATPTSNAPTRAPSYDGDPGTEKAARSESNTAHAANETARLSLLNRESSLLIRARSELRGGAISKARATLAELDGSVPRGILGQEREVLRIELLAASGDVAGAARRAEAFVRTHPTSPHTQKLNRFLQSP